MFDKPAAIVKPRVVLTQNDDGTVTMEYYVNGQRTQETLLTQYGNDVVMESVKEAFAHQRRVAESHAERLALRAEMEEKARHRRVWFHAAYARGQGEAFANRVIGPLAPKAAKPVGIEATEDLI